MFHWGRTTHKGVNILGHLWFRSWFVACLPVNVRDGVYCVTWWRHQMETFSMLLAICAGNSPVTNEFPSQRLVTRSFGVFFICAWINCWVHNREAADMRRHRANYDVTVMSLNSDVCSISVSAVLFAISYYSGPLYNCTRLYHRRF